MKYLSCFTTIIHYNKTSIKWTPGSLSQQKEKNLGQKLFFEQKQIRKMHESCIIND